MSNKYPFEKEFGEAVSPGHPDKLADAVADTIVSAVYEKDSSALVGVEVGVSLDRVFVTGRIATNGKLLKSLDLNAVARKVFQEAGYGQCHSDTLWLPDPDCIEVDTTGLIMDEIQEDERQVRNLSDDQSITVGYAVNSPETNYIPRGQWLAWQVMREIRMLTSERQDRFGPDAKVLTEITNREDSWIFDRLVVSMQHSSAIDWSEIGWIVYRALNSLQKRFGETGVGCTFDPGAIDLIINGHGDFSTGGPLGDNGLSGKKLVMDAYGPMVPIGGGAYSGKDPHKVDRAGAILAREMALHSVINEASPWETVQLTWAPGKPHYVALNSLVLQDFNRQLFPQTIQQCVDRYFRKPIGESFAEFAVKGWFSGVSKAPWEKLIPGRQPVDRPIYKRRHLCLNEEKR
jgi:S-adenosylmethionine synthetase